MKKAASNYAGVVLSTIGLTALLFARVGVGGGDVDSPRCLPAEGPLARGRASASPVVRDRGRDHRQSRSPRWGRASYVHRSAYKTGAGSRFPLTDLALRVNRLSKDSRAFSELADVVAQMADGQRFDNASVIDLSLLINGVAKLPEQSGCRRAAIQVVRRLAEEVCTRLPDSRVQSQTLAMMVNGLSKFEDEEVTRCLDALAQEVAERRNLRQWTAQHLTMVACGIGKGEGSVMTSCLVALAQEVVGRDLSQWTAPELAMAASGLSKAEDRKITKAMKAVAKEVINRKRMLAQWQPQDLAMMASGISKAGGKTITRALRALADEIAGRDRSQWTEQILAMTSNGISKAEGEEITRALTALAQDIVRRCWQLSYWSAQHLAIVASGISKAQGGEITQAMKAIAQGLANRDLSGWTERQLVLVVNGISRAKGEEISNGIATLAREIAARERELGQWSMSYMTMAVNGVSSVEGPEVIQCLRVLAREILGRNLGGLTQSDLAVLVSGISKGRGEEVFGCLNTLVREISKWESLDSWTEQHLAMVISGISKWEGQENYRMLQTMAQEIGRRDLGQWAVRYLAMAASGAGSIAHHSVFTDLIIELVERAKQEPVWLLTTVKRLCRLQLAGEQAVAALALVSALYKTGYQPDGEEAHNKLLWCLTLIHFSYQKLSGFGHQISQRLAGFYRHYLDASSHPSAPRGVSGDQPDPSANYWQSLFVRDYWQKVGGGQPAAPVVCYPTSQEPVSVLQNRIYGVIKQEFPQREIGMEVSINHFPVDILIDRHICIEVDGAVHFVRPLQPQKRQGEPADAQAEGLPGHRRAKDLFMDHMLEQYGYTVFRIPYTLEPGCAEFGMLMDRIRAALMEAESPEAAR